MPAPTDLVPTPASTEPVNPGDPPAAPPEGFAAPETPAPDPEAASRLLWMPRIGTANAHDLYGRGRGLQVEVTADLSNLTFSKPRPISLGQHP